jgi:hypothetical protein
MAKSRKQITKKALPYVTAFLVCEKALMETDHVASAIRIVDILNLASDQNLEVGHGAVFPMLTLLVITKAGEARGERQFTLKLVTPEPGPVKHSVGTWTTNFADPPESGQNLRFTPVGVVWAGEGLYYFEVSVDESVLARTPLRINVGPAAAATETPVAQQ